jgi:thymidylate synthase
MSDFICTDAVHVFLRYGRSRCRCPELHYVVYMRSNDAVFGYKNDLAWHEFVVAKLVNDLKISRPNLGNLEPQLIQWNAASLHVYRRHFLLMATGEDS